jgi:hypothetical protein
MLEEEALEGCTFAQNKMYFLARAVVFLSTHWLSSFFCFHGTPSVVKIRPLPPT